MNHHDRIARALSAVAREHIPDGADLWPNLAVEIERQKTPAPGARLKLSWTVVLVLLGLVTASTAAYAFYRKMTDPGLQGVEDAGLITDLNQVAEPTVFVTPASPQASSGGVSQTQKGVSVTLEWAYADESRLAMQFTILGLSIPPGIRPDELICTPYLTSDEPVSFGLSGSQINVLEDKPEKPVQLTYEFHQPIDASRYDHLDLRLDLTLGPCADYWNFSETNVKKPTPPALIGNYQLAFRVPVYQGLTLTPSQTVEAGGVRMRLESISLNLSFTNLRLCYQLPSHGQPAETADFMPEASLQIGQGEPARLVSFQTSQDGRSQDRYCTDLGFAVPYDGQPETIVLTVERLLPGPELDGSQEVFPPAIEGPWVFKIKV